MRRLVAACERPRLVMALLVLFGLVLRVPGLFHDFWLDEVWSLRLLHEYVSAPLDILTRIPLDNNHPLNTFFLYVIGTHSAWFLYRIPSLILGTGTVVMAGRIMRRRGASYAYVTMLLVACSYPLVVYSSEARGYAPMTFFLLVAIDALERWVSTRARAVLLVFWIAIILGSLSHLTFLQGYGAMMLWSGYELARRLGWRDGIGAWLTAHAVPLIFVTALYIVYVSRIQVAGAEPAALVSVLGTTAAVTMGFSDLAPWPLVASIALAGLLTYGLVVMGTSDRGRCLFFAAGIVVIPALAVAHARRGAILEPRFFPRYFLVSITLFLLFSGWAFVTAYEAGRVRKALAVPLLAVYVSANLWQVGRFIEGGRGGYREAVAYMAAAGGQRTIRVASNSDVRTPILLDFYSAYLPVGANLVYYPHGRASSDGDAEWYIVEDLEPTAAMPPAVRDAPNRQFEVVRRFPFYGLSGCQWTLYRRTNHLETVPPPRSAPR